MSVAQRRALLTLLGLIVAGHGVRTWLLRHGELPGAITLLQPASDADLARQRATTAAAARPMRPGERLDLNLATAADLTRLPGVGDGLARRIIEHRDAQGPYRSLADLDRVPGIGPALLKRVGGHLLQGGGGEALPVEGVPAGESPLAEGVVDLNRATEADLLRLPGIGPTKARAIVAYRQARGPFASVAELIGVPGIGPATMAGLAGRVAVR